MRYQMRCPECGHEFTYDNGYYDKNIARLGVEIRDLMLQLAEHKKLPWPEQKRRTDWWLDTKKKLTVRQKELAELKAVRKVCDQQIKAMEHQIFKNLVKEKFGEEVYRKLLEQAESDLEAYKISGLMRHEYTRSGSKANATSVGKL